MRQRTTQSDHPIYTMDIETDPFVHGVKPEPFAVGFYDGKKAVRFWGKDCILDAVKYIDTVMPGIIYMHYGGRFDVFYFLDWIGKDLIIVSGRVLKCSIGKHEVRDSYAIIPVRLSDYKKIEIDIQLLIKKNREKNKKEILAYLDGDVIFLWELVTEFRKKFGDVLTIGGASKRELFKLYKIEHLNKQEDVIVRKNYFLGGRVEYFQRGYFTGKFKYYDVNSMYPYCMKAFQHPIGNISSTTNYLTDETFFLTVYGESHGAFAVKTKAGTSFPRGVGTYSVTIHEYKAATETGMFVCHEILECLNFERKTSFANFVDKFYALKEKAVIENNKADKTFYKSLLNNSWGKLTQNPENFRDYLLVRDGTNYKHHGWELAEFNSEYALWERPSYCEDSKLPFINVATGASVTGAARSVILRALAGSTRPMYCDTDSIICEELGGVPESETELGAWKLVGEGNRLAIAGKKLYVLLNKNKTVAIATKGCRIPATSIIDVAQGKTVEWKKESPAYKLDGSVRWIKRKIRAT